MKLPALQNSDPLPSEQDILALEVALTKRLPKDYRAFLLATNGGWPVYKTDLCVDIHWNEMPSSDVREFLGVRRKVAHKNILDFRGSMSEWGIPDSLMVFSSGTLS